MDFENHPVAIEIGLISQRYSPTERNKFYKSLQEIYAYIATKTSVLPFEQNAEGEELIIIEEDIDGCELEKRVNGLRNAIPLEQLNMLLTGVYTLAEQHGVELSLGETRNYDDIIRFFEKNGNTV